MYDEMWIYALTDSGNSLNSPMSTYRGYVDIMGGPPLTYSYSKGTQLTAGPLTLFIIAMDEWTFGDYASIVLHFTDGTKLRIHLPAITITYNNNVLTLWVAEDGSTYYGHSAKQPLDYFSFLSEREAWNTDAYYATHWEINNLAVSSYDHANGGTSLAVDAGSMDWLSGGTTKTSHFGYPIPNGISGYQDNSAPDNYDYPDSESNLTHFISHPIDLGYHYGSAEQIFLNDSYYTTLRNPRDSIDTFDYMDFEDLEPKIDEECLAIASGNYNNLVENKDRTLICFATNQVIIEENSVDMRYQFIGYKRFRESGTKVVRQLSPRQYDIDIPPYDIIGHPNVTHLSMTTSQNSTSGDSTPIFLASTIRMDNYNAIYPYDYIAYSVYVYRYDPPTLLNPERWIMVGALETLVYEDKEGTYLNEIDDIAITADGDDLTVVWVESLRLFPDIISTELKAYRIEDASTRMTADNINPQPLYRPLYYNLSIETRLSADWDNAIQMPRISWNERISDTSPYSIWSARVGYDNGQPNRLIAPSIISGNPVYDCAFPTISVNRYIVNNVNNTNSSEAFSIFSELGTYDLMINTLELTSGNDSWTGPIPFTDSDEIGSVTYRGFGTEKTVFIKDNKLISNTDELYPSNIYTKSPVITTNKMSNTDIFTTFYTDKIIIQGINP